MKIAIGSFQCEGNSLTPVLTRFKDFDYAVGEAMYEKIAIMDRVKELGIEVVPAVYAHALPGGPVVKEDCEKIVEEMVSRIPAEGIDGIWLYLHGAMCVQDIGSGEEYLLKKIREKVGFEIPVAVAMDMHADNSDAIPRLANFVTGFKTIPHRDHAAAQLRALNGLVTMIEKKILPHPQLSRCPVVICGDAVQTDLEPLKSICDEADRMEKLPGMLSVQIFNGQPWVDEPYMGPNFVVTHENDEKLARECADKLARMFWEARYDFRFLIEAVTPEEAIELAMSAKEKTVFISDSGDNTTAGAAGDNGFMINRLQKLGAKNVLVAGIMDEEACEKCYAAKLGDILSLDVGGSLDKNSEKAHITGKLIHRGDMLAYNYDNAGPTATLDCGDMTVVITKNRAAMCRPDIFASVDLDYTPFKAVVVKLGYLFPELAEVAERSILAFTPGSSTERLEDMHMKNIARPMFPLDDNFM